MAYYFDKTTDVRSNKMKVFVKINNHEYTFFTDNNVFSKKGLDFGTRSLLESIDLKTIKGDILDFGCGYGPIGIYLATNIEGNVDMIDVNERSIKLAQENAEINKANVNIFYSDIYSNVNKKYDYIVSNPPIRVGKEILYKILFKAYDYLKDNGHLIIVINKDQGAKSTIKNLEQTYLVKIINKNKGFYVIDCQKH